MKQLTPKELFELFDPTIHDPIRMAVANYPDAESVVVFENPDLCSLSMGARTALVCGPSNTYKSWEDTKGKWLYDLPSQRQYPIGYVLAKDLKT